MRLLDRVVGWFGYAKTATIANPPAWLTASAEAERWEIPLDGGLPESQAELYQKLSWVQIAVAAVAQMAATTALGVQQLTGEEASAVPNHPLELLLKRPNPLDSRYEFMEATFAYKLITGNAYWWLNRTSEDRPPAELWLLPPHKVRPVPDGRMYLRGYVYDAGFGREIALEPWEVVHFRRFHPLSRWQGLSPLEALEMTTKGDLAMQRWNTNYFAKDNAKPAGALAYADPIDDASWGRMKSDIRDQHGGTKRSLMMLRNVGKGGVSWLNMAMSQKDMEFLAGRTFNKEEIFSLYAPGLSSVLAVNATEANATTGKGTFVEMAVWPQLTSVAEKITNDLLPAYGDNLVAAFDDIRVTDRQLLLSEQAAFERVHTIDEVRAKFYQADPLGDERGNLLIGEVGKGLTNAEPTPAQPEPAPTPAQPPALPDHVDMQPPDQPGDNTPVGQAKAPEIKRLRKWLKRRANPDVTQFKSDILSSAEKALIAQGEDASGSEETPFDWTGKATHDAGDDQKRSELERYHADKIEQAFGKLLRLIVPPGADESNLTPDLAVERYKQNEALLRDALVAMLLDGAHLGGQTGGTQINAALGVKAEIVAANGVDWDLINEAVQRWVLGTTGGGFGAYNTDGGYVDSITLALMQTSERQIRQEIGEWVANALTRKQLIERLTATVFSMQRAEMIAVTEITRAYAEGNRIAFRESGVVSQIEMQTANDERVCPVCGPLQGKRFDLEKGEPTLGFPPFHVRCRCWIVPVVSTSSTTEG